MGNEILKGHATDAALAALQRMRINDPQLADQYAKRLKLTQSSQR